MRESIQKAIEGGWNKYKDEPIEFFFYDECRPKWQEITSDPLFWQCLGKSLRWEKKMVVRRGTVIGNFMCENKGIRFYGEEMGCGMDYLNPWVYHWHRFIDHLAEGKDAGEFFNTLLN